MIIFDKDFWYALILVCSIKFVAFIIYFTAERNNYLMKQCMDDGRKEYECHAMIIGAGQ